MKKILIGGAVVAALIIGTPFVMSYAMDSFVHGAIAGYNDDADNDYTIQYDTLETDWMSGTINATALTLTGKDSDDNERISIARVDGNIGHFGFLFGLPTVDLTFDRVSVSDDDASASIDYASFQKLNLQKLKAHFEEEARFEFPLGGMQLRDFRLETSNTNIDETTNAVKVALDSFVFQTSPDGSKLEEFELNGTQVKTSLPQVGFNLDRLYVRGGSMETLEAILDYSLYPATDPDALEKQQKNVARLLTDFQIDYSNLEELKMTGLSFTIQPNPEAQTPFTTDIGAIYINNISREKGIITSIDSGINGLSVPNLLGFSPQADQLLQKIGFTSFALDGYSNMSLIDGDTMAYTSAYTAKNLLTLDVDARLKSSDYFAMQKAVAKAQYATNLKDVKMWHTEDLVPQENDDEAADAPENDDLLALKNMLVAYARYLERMDSNLKVTDHGLNTLIAKLQNAQNGLPLDQARQTAILPLYITLASLFGTSTPANLQEAISGYFAETSQPMALQINLDAPIPESTLEDMNAQNWHEAFEIKVISGGK